MTNKAGAALGSFPGQWICRSTFQVQGLPPYTFEPHGKWPLGQSRACSVRAGAGLVAGPPAPALHGTNSAVPRIDAQ